MIEQRLQEDLKEAMKNKDTVTKNTIQSIRAAILNIKKNIGKDELTDEEIEVIIVKERKQREDALEQFRKAEREDLITQTTEELSVINKYLPEQMSEEDIRKEIEKIIAEQDTPLLGLIIREAKSRLGNKADGKTISTIVKQLLEGDKNV